MTDDTTTTDREEAARAGVRGEWKKALDVLAVGNALEPAGFDARRRAAAATLHSALALNDPATILADIEEGKRKDATIERLRRERDAETDRAIEWENKAMTLILERDELALMAAELASEVCCGCSDGEFLDEARRRILITKGEDTDV